MGAHSLAYYPNSEDSNMLVKQASAMKTDIARLPVYTEQPHMETKNRTMAAKSWDGIIEVAQWVWLHRM